MQSISPKTKKELHIHSKHNDQREDYYYWLRNRDNTEVIDYLNQENNYTNEVLEPISEFKDQLYDEIVGRIKKDDSSPPYFKNHYWYYVKFEEENEYPIYCRKKENLEAEEEIILDVNLLAKDKSYCHVASLSISPNNEWLCYGVDFISRRIYKLVLVHLPSGQIVETGIENTVGGASWANDNETLFYALKHPETLRHHQIKKWNRNNNLDELVFEEKDETFYVGVSRSKSGQFLIIHSHSTLTNEASYISADQPQDKPKVFLPREKGHEYSIDHHPNAWYILSNKNGKNFELFRCLNENTSIENWETLIKHKNDVLLEGIELFKNHLVIEKRFGGLTHLEIMNLENHQMKEIEMEEEAYSCWISVNRDLNSEWFRFAYQSMTTPPSTYDYHLITEEKKLIKRQELEVPYNPQDYQSERLWVEARDGTQVPISLVYKKDLKSSKGNPLLLYGYGSYGNSLDPWFSSVRLSLLNRGFVFAIAHIRGGEEMGRDWYENGRQLKKKNTFYDFVDCAKHLVNQCYTTSEKLFAMGGSAGGLLMGAVMNFEPSLWKGIVAQVPFVDVVTTMLDDTIPLTTGEYDEWGNPNEEKFYQYMKSYSPYDNLESKDYPNILVTTGLHDSQVQYWEPAKWVARLRDLKTDNNLLLFSINMDAGHGGASGRFQRHKETALEYAFILGLIGINE